MSHGIVVGPRWTGREGEKSEMDDRSLVRSQRARKREKKERETETPKRLKRGIRRDVDEKVTHRSRHTI